MYVHKPKDTDKHEHSIKHLVYILTVTVWQRDGGNCNEHVGVLVAAIGSRWGSGRRGGDDKGGVALGQPHAGRPATGAAIHGQGPPAWVTAVRLPAGVACGHSPTIQAANVSGRLRA
ncbi:hypothetical protein BHE74_00017490 [Ensete ventricosum]|nr:hypothetical protein BHE74_00017490 [Ensete ventricosum]